MSVYFMRGKGMLSPVKIGCSYYTPRRLRAHEAGSPVELEIIAELDGSHAIERRFHAKFLDSHERCEWFTWSPELQHTVEAINSGEFDVSSLPPPTYLPRRRASVEAS